MAEVTALSTDTVGKVNLPMFRTGHKTKIARRVAQGVPVDVVDMFLRSQLATKKSLHDETMFGFIMSCPDHHVSVSILDVDPRKDLVTSRFPVSSVESVVVAAQPFRKDGQLASCDRAGSRVSIRLGRDGRIAMSAESMVVHSAHSLDCGRTRTIANRTVHGSVPFLNSLYPGQGRKSSQIGDSNG